MDQAVAHGVKVEVKQSRLKPPEALEGLSEEQKKLHDVGLDRAKQRVRERALKHHGK